MHGRVDWDDRFFGVVFLLASAVAVGLLTVPGTSMFSDPMLTIGDGAEAADFSLAKIISLIALMATIVSNRTDWSKLAGVEFWAAIVTVGLVIAPPFMPLLAAFLGSSVIAALFAMIIQAGGFFVISYLG